MINICEIFRLKITETIEKNIEYSIFPYHFFLLNIVGLWYPKSAASSIQFIFKSLFFIILCLQISVYIEMQVYAITALSIVENSYCVVIFSGIYKMARLFTKREEITSLLQEYEFNVAEKKEEHIYQKFATEIRFE